MPFFSPKISPLLCLKVHSGFFSSYNNTILRLAITSAVHKARQSYGDINVIVTGHSMGGAMASFCALDLAVSTPEAQSFTNTSSVQITDSSETL